MRAPITTNKAMDASRLAFITVADGASAPKSSATATPAANTSTLRHGRAPQRFQAIVQAATVGTSAKPSGR
jgi:hypothetical protein